MFGPTLAQLVEGVTKLNKMFFSSASAAQAANFRKMLFAMTNDVRVILIKLADRLHNIRTLQYLPPVKQKYVARETIEIYAPLAHRLGINKVKSELEETSFRFLQPEKAREIYDFLNSTGLEGDSKLKEAMQQIEEHLKEFHINARITGRPKQAYSIYNKTLKYNTTIEGLYDFLGIRIITESVKDCYGALGMVHKYWKPIPGRFKDYIAVPKPNMYQSLHTTVIFDGKPLEVQIRTDEMHRIAEEGIAAHWDYKESCGKEAAPDYKEKLSWLRNLIDWYKDVKDASEFMETVKVELFEYHVYVFTPKGEVIELPNGSTPIDFAFAIHTAVSEPRLTVT
jgi:GTP pyrophosphokinase